MQPILESSRTEYLLGDLEAGCGHADAAKKHYERAAGLKGAGQVAWASKAARKLGNYDEAKWHAELMRAAASRGERSGKLSTPITPRWRNWSWEIKQQPMRISTRHS